jgi:hypothetical protein
VTHDGRPPAERKADQQDALRRAFLGRYDHDDEFRAALQTLADAAETAGFDGSSLADSTATPAASGEAGSEEMSEFRRRLEAISMAYGLDRLGQAGRAHIEAWCARYVRARRSGSFPPSLYGPHRFSTARLPPTSSPT